MKQLNLVFPNSINQIDEILSDFSIENIFLVRGNNSYVKSGAEKGLTQIFKKYKITSFSNFTVNPKLEEAKKGYQLFKISKSNLIIAIGGGSVIDMAKLIKYQYINDKNNNNFFLPFIAIPTTAGTGSEATHFAVVYISKEKHSYANKLLLPNIALVDSNLLNGQNDNQMAVSGLDAFAQAIESFWSVNSTDESMRFSEKAIKLIWGNLKKAIAGDKQARVNIAEGSFYAGKAINITKTTAPHALSYGFTSLFGLSHGHAVSLFLPFFINYHKSLSKKDCNDERGNIFVRRQIIKISNFINTDVDDLESSVRSFITSLEIETSFKNLGIDKLMYTKAIEKVSLERLNNNPGRISYEKILNIYNLK